MIHGAPEIMNRLRTKTNNFAFLSGLFLAASVSLLYSQPDIMESCLKSKTRTLASFTSSDSSLISDEVACQIASRMFFYLTLMSGMSHILCILLSNAFDEVCIETAREADVCRYDGKNSKFITQNDELINFDEQAPFGTTPQSYAARARASHTDEELWRARSRLYRS